MRRALALAVALVAVHLCSSAGAANGSWQSFTDPTYGLRVAIPASWHTVPPTVAGVRSTITQLEKQNNAGLATVYSTFIDSPEARANLVKPHFQAFQYVPNDDVQPDFALYFSRTTPALAKEVSTMSATFAQKYAAGQHAVVSKHAMVRLPAGPVAFFEGTQSAGGRPVQFQIYVIGHGDLLYEFSFRADARATAEAATFRAIMNHFHFT
jgi:hypothetical protein